MKSKLTNTTTNTKREKVLFDFSTILTWDDRDPVTGLRGWIYKWSGMEGLPLALPVFDAGQGRPLE